MNMPSSISLITFIASEITSGRTVDIAFPVPINYGISTIIISGCFAAIVFVSSALLAHIQDINSVSLHLSIVVVISLSDNGFSE